MNRQIKPKDRIRRIFDGVPLSFRTFSEKFISYTTKLIHNLNVKEVEKVVQEIFAARGRGSTIFIIGNGGSAATATHFAQDLARIGTTDADLPPALLNRKKNYFKKTPFRPFRAVSLTDNIAYISALGNDEGFDNIFTGQLRSQYRKGDILVVISGSGNSPNIISAIKYVKERKGKTFGILGFDGGNAVTLCDYSILINSQKGAYGPVEFIHIALVHLIRDYLKARLE